MRLISRALSMIVNYKPKVGRKTIVLEYCAERSVKIPAEIVDLGPIFRI